MRPAFSSSRQAAVFALLLLALLLAPALAGKRFLPSREQIYSSIWWASGDYPFFYHQIFQEREPIDILFIGASHIHTAFGTPYVQEQLIRELGRPAVARTFGWGWPGYDNLYFVTRDLLVHRQVRMLVFDDLYSQTDKPHILAPHMFRFGDDAASLDGLPWSLKASYYFGAVVGMPHNLMGLVRTNFAPNLHPGKPTHFEIHDRALNPVTQLGALTEHLGYAPDFLADYYLHPPFVEYTPQTGAQPSCVCIYSGDTKTNFAFTGAAIPPLQLHFVQKFAALVREHGCQLVLVHIPFYDERRSTVITEPVFWPDVLGTNVTMIGIPPAMLFKGLTDDEIRELYSDPVHLNENGQKYFTTLMMPALLKLYESQNP
ncbi:MAG TPA: hypothetical protein VMH87_17185 [Pseudomonadales bacterium]|nr:hypothetical protein [Pseudomonadales bacterium]